MNLPILTFTLICCASLASACGEVALDEERQETLLAQVQAAPNERAAREVTNELWELWATAPDTYAQELLDEGMQRRAAYDFDNAIVAFDALTEYCPDYAEGYNQRAFVLFIRQDYEAALTDLDEALARAPRHVAALAGRALTFMALERNEEALRDLQAALALNPWLPERRFLDGLKQAQPGKSQIDL